jgi:soluble lytic murein transglycosylase-like protein
MQSLVFRVIIVVLLFVALSNNSRADCFDEAAAYHHVNPAVIRAISIIESGGRSLSVNINSNGSVDYGLMQINSSHLRDLARFGIYRRDLLDGCTSIFVGAWLLRREMERYGNTWAAVGAYHSATPGLRDSYAKKVRAIVYRLVGPIGR